MKKIYTLVTLFLLASCATYQIQVKENSAPAQVENAVEVEHTFYLIGDAGNSALGVTSNALQGLSSSMRFADKKTTVLFLGDNIYPKGLPGKKSEGYELAKHRLKAQADVVKDIGGKAIFIPGNHDWYSGIDGLERQQKYIEDKLGKNSFLPKNGCPIETVEISENVQLIVIDSEWFLTNWNKHPKMNDDCEIKTKAKFFEEFEGAIKKARGKTTLIAVHHPMFSNGPHGGQYSFADHMKPIPVIGTLKNLIRKTGGVSPADIQNKNYQTFRNRLVTLAQENKKAIFVSGHEHSLQYLIQDNVPQIISGAGSKATATRNVGGGEFSYGGAGYARIDIHTDGSSKVVFTSVDDQLKETNVFKKEIYARDDNPRQSAYANNFPTTKKSAVYTKQETDKSNFYEKIWGKRYRKYYSTEIDVPTVNLDTLFGGLTPIRKGGGHQSISLRMVNPEGKEYVMRAIKKSAEVYLQAMAFKDQYIVGDFENTVTETILQDFYTGSHPYAPFTIGPLSDAIGIYHPNPVLYFVPKQNALGKFNGEFGDVLYMIEERVTDGHGDQASFGFANTIESTDDVLKKLRKDEKYSIDSEMYLRARLFDMVIGDWDRHIDQWRWAKFEENDKVIYRPIPRDRDQAFSIMGDGFLMRIGTRIVPPLRLMEGFLEEIRNVKGFNASPYSLDMVMLNQMDKSQWLEQVNHIQKNLTDAVIDDALMGFPEAVRDETVIEIRRVLKSRLQHLKATADEYFDIINKTMVIRGTDKDDWFDIERKANGITTVKGYRIKNKEKADLFFSRAVLSTQTKEIWIYGLDDDDHFHVHGTGNNIIKLRIIGGQNKDVYQIENGSGVKIYDFKSKKSEFLLKKGKVKLTDDYFTNVYDYTKLKNNINQFIPTIGANPDDGLKLGFVNTYTTYGFARNPFTSLHNITAAFYFATNGFELGYRGEFAKVFGNWNLGIEAAFTSPNFSKNFFGFGNDTPNLNDLDEDNFDMDYNRVKLQTLKFAPSLNYRTQSGAHLEVTASYESIEVEETENRFINTFYASNNEDVENEFIGAEAKFDFENSDNAAFPTLGMHFNIALGHKINIDNSNSFTYLMPSLSFDYKLIPSGQLVFATKFKSHFNFGNGFEFYQAANIGGNDGLRAYRNQRFTGKSAYYQSSDIRLNLTSLRTKLLPVHIGIYGGFDYGRIWVDDDLVFTSNINDDQWNTSIGGGVFVNAANIVSLNLSAFTAREGMQLAFKMGFGF